jgi:hypothetical protein
LPEAISTERNTQIFGFSQTSDRESPLGLHADYVPPVTAEAGRVAITFHFTVRGIAEGIFFRTGPRFLETQQSDARMERAYRLVEKGVVDSELMQPLRFRSLSRAGTLLIFRNGDPLIHGFRSTTSDRKSRAFDGLIRTTAAMETHSRVWHRAQTASS